MGCFVKLLFIFLILNFNQLFASDLEKEQRWADQIVDALLDGEDVWLKSGEHDFLSIYTESEEPSKKAIIVVHGTGVHPDWGQVIKPLRVEMINYGWNTLSVQMPILSNEATYADYVPLYPEVPARLKAAEEFLLAKGINEIAYVSHSQGATMTAYYLAGNQSSATAFVAIGMGATQKDRELNSADSLKSITLPVLDLYGEHDLPGVLATLEKRAAGAANNAAYVQQQVLKAGHFFDHENEQLIDAVQRWLNSL